MFPAFKTTEPVYLQVLFYVVYGVREYLESVDAYIVESVPMGVLGFSDESFRVWHKSEYASGRIGQARDMVCRAIGVDGEGARVALGVNISESDVAV